MIEPRIVTPEEAQDMADASLVIWTTAGPDLAHTVATEPERTRAAVIEALQAEATRLRYAGFSTAAAIVHQGADAIENGADW